jgi:hypothetical protein
MSYEEKCKELEDEHRQENENMRNVESTYRFAESLLAKYKDFESGDGRVQYYAGGRVVNVHLTATSGKHPIKEALILLDEITFPEDLKESRVPEGIGEDDSIYWSWQDEEKGIWLHMYVQLREGGGCRQVGTGKFKEVLVWKCI